MADDDGSEALPTRSACQGREQKAWYWYDWANSAFVTTIAAVLFAPYLTRVAEKAACGASPTTTRTSSARRTSASSGLDVSRRLAAVLPDHLRHDPVAPSCCRSSARSPTAAPASAAAGGFAWTGRASAALMFFVRRRQLAARRRAAARRDAASSAPAWSSTTRSWSRSPTPTSATGSRRAAGRSATSAAACCSRVNCVLLTVDERQHRAWRCGSACSRRRSGGRLHVHPGTAASATTPAGQRGRRSRRAGQGELRPALAHPEGPAQLPVTLTFLLAYLFFNDGIQTVIYAASVYGEKELGFEKSTVLIARSWWCSSSASAARSSSAGWRGAVGAYRVDPGRPVRLDGGRRRRLAAPRATTRAVPAAGRRDRHRARRHPGAVPVVLQPADPPRPRGGVLLALPGVRARHVVVRHPDLRPGATS